MHTAFIRNKQEIPTWSGAAPASWHIALVAGVLIGIAIGGAL